MLSDQLYAAVKTSRLRQYQLAHLIDVHPATLSAWVNKIYRVKTGDPRVVRLGALLGVPPEKCFAEPAAATPVPTLTDHAAAR